MAAKALLQVEGVETYYGNIRALNGVDVAVNEGEIVALIGANGAGKSTLMRALSGLLRPVSGGMSLGREDISRLPAHRVVG